MSKKKRCAACGQDITHKNFVQFVVDGKITKFCSVKCYTENFKDDKKTNGVNRNLCSDFIRVR